MKPTYLLLAASAILVAGLTSAHHSFAIYDVDNRIERTGRLSKIVFASPHIQFVLEAETADGSKETWQVESMNPGRWDQSGIPRDIVAVGEQVTLLGWPARNGKDDMLLSTIITERGTTVVIDEVRQSRAREDLPEVTVTRQ